jgi:hypothetical protein
MIADSVIRDGSGSTPMEHKQARNPDNHNSPGIC